MVVLVRVVVGLGCSQRDNFNAFGNGGTKLTLLTVGWRATVVRTHARMLVMAHPVRLANAAREIF